MIDLKNLRELSKDLKVLYVEDDILVSQSMLNYLKKIFSSVICGFDGLEGLSLYQSQKFDIVITDLSMPKMNGIDMITQIKEQNENQAILITSAHSESEYMFTAMKLGVDGYIIKPFEYKQLNQELFKIAEKINKFKENEAYKNHLKDIVNKKTLELNENYEKTLYLMIDLIEKRDTYTAGHSKRVANYCQLIAKEMGYSDEECTTIHQAGVLHDIGKIGTPDAVLLNPNKLNEIEYKLIQEHAEVGYKLLNKIPMFKSLADIVYAHHERYDGLGYPNNLKSDEINPLSRIMIVADAFDAMTTNRIYKSSKTVPEAIDELKMLSKEQFHPEVVKSAVIALKDIKIDTDINQLPKTRLEEERFAYFYKDTLGDAFNQNYLNVVLMKNNCNLVYKNIKMISINNFTAYNKKYGWEKGDELLKKFTDILLLHFHNDLIFRVFGDDFVVMSKNEISLDNEIKALDNLTNQNNLTYIINNINLTTQKIKNITDIEMIQSNY
ncbi:MAG: response regulator [Campylobacterota bacterium]|nr:response regulator [Campylobacterota bacterium]